MRNRRDGAVEALFAGPEESSLAMIEACRQGPPGARVDAVDQRDGTAEELALRRRGELFSVLRDGLSVNGCAEQRLEGCAQRHVDLRHRRRHGRDRRAR